MNDEFSRPCGTGRVSKPTHLRAGLLSATLVQISFFDGWMPTVLLEKRSAVEGPAVDPRRLQTLVEAPPYPLSSREVVSFYRDDNFSWALGSLLKDELSSRPKRRDLLFSQPASECTGEHLPSPLSSRESVTLLDFSRFWRT
jgi:hypothetical protein